MNLYEQEFRKIFENCQDLYDRKYTGRTMLAKIDQNLRVKASFVTTGVSGNYDAVRLRIINHTEGEVDVQTFRFREIFNNAPSAVTAYIRDDYGPPRWYNYSPGPYEYKQLAEALGGYISMYQDETLEMSGQAM
ncbi:hypothetical protein D1841_14175 [Neglecta sp. X4]|jgi:hypothetical protein|uniref:hypothetical protein n=1 Tax=unclassified Neglectibacter TaxID=2632164 RepID=UPI00136EDB05|nr:MULTISPECIES: hypothetical protein [unclassified Neglectibacter]NBI18702.1 hypothetical protein [Neglectibacter sp. 59]NBJ74380.1 hypothetical protein [Neglectibacter sp. X4]NCE82144.1 hypothetical protein [Neglectibacter sp. X58]